MLNLSNPTSEIILVTGSPVSSIEVHVSYVDWAPPATTVTPGSANFLISTAGATTIVASPPPGMSRNVKFLSIQNNSGSPCAIVVRHFDGAITVPVFGITLLSDWTVQYSTDGSGFIVYDAAGNILVRDNTALAISAGTTLASTGTIAFSNSNGVSFGMNGNTVTASFVAGGVASLNVSAGTSSALLSAITFSNSNGVSFGLNGSTLTGSIATSLTAINVSAGTTSNNLSAITFSNSNNVSFGLNGSVVTASASAASSQGSINFSGGTTSNNLSAITFANSNGVSFGLNGSTMTASVAGTVGTVSCFSQDADFVTNFTAGQAVFSLQKFSLPMNMLATQLVVLADFLGNSAMSDAVTLSHAIYALSGGTASLASSGSRAISWASGSATTASSLYGGVSGTRYRTMGVSYAMTPGDYLFGWWVSTANGVVVRPFGRMGANIVGTFDGVETNYFLNGSSISSVAAFPGSVAATDTGYARTGFSALLQPGVVLVGTH